MNFKIFFLDDLDISPDFYEYFSATYRVLSSDPTLWCVSAWNDNGKRGMVQDDPGELLLDGVVLSVFFLFFFFFFFFLSF